MTGARRGPEKLEFLPHEGLPSGPGDLTEPDEPRREVSKRVRRPQGRSDQESGQVLVRTSWTQLAGEESRGVEPINDLKACCYQRLRRFCQYRRASEREG